GAGGHLPGGARRRGDQPGPSARASLPGARGLHPGGRHRAPLASGHRPAGRGAGGTLCLSPTSPPCSSPPPPPAPPPPSPPSPRQRPRRLRRAVPRARAPPGLPRSAEPDLTRHFPPLSRRNFAIDVGFYPLGSCTMKHNPRINERVAALPGFRGLHPLQRPEAAQGMLRVLFDLGEMLGEIAGLPATTLQPAAGAHGELTGLMLALAYP